MLKRRPTKTLLSAMNFLRAAGEATAEDIAVAIGAKNLKALQRALRRWTCEKEYVVVKLHVKQESGGRPKPIYALSDNARTALENHTFHLTVADEARRAPKPRFKSNSVAIKEILGCKKKQEFIKLNHDVVRHADIAKELGVTIKTVDNVLQALACPLATQASILRQLRFHRRLARFRRGLFLMSGAEGRRLSCRQSPQESIQSHVTS